MNWEDEDDEAELELGDAERMALLFMAGMMLADMIAHPEGTRTILER